MYKYKGVNCDVITLHRRGFHLVYRSLLAVNRSLLAVYKSAAAVYRSYLILTGAFEVIAFPLDEEIEEVVNDAEQHVRLLGLQRGVRQNGSQLRPGIRGKGVDGIVGDG